MIGKRYRRRSAHKGQANDTGTAKRAGTADAEGLVDAYFEAWNDPDPVRRAALLQETVSDEVDFFGPTGRLTGRDQLLDTIVEARELLPGATVARVGSVEVDDGIRLCWEARGPEGKRLAAGCEVINVAADGRIGQIMVALGSDTVL